MRSLVARHVHGLAYGDKPQNVPSPQMALKIVDTRKTFNSLEQSLQKRFYLIRENVKATHYSFVEDSGQDYNGTQYPHHQ